MLKAFRQRLSQYDQQAHDEQGDHRRHESGLQHVRHEEDDARRPEADRDPPSIVESRVEEQERADAEEEKDSAHESSDSRRYDEVLHA